MADAVHNPYSPGSVPTYLAGRAQELVLIRDRLARVSELGRSGGPLLAFYGSRGLGKTSLLRAAQREAQDAGFLTVWETGRDDMALTPRLAQSLSRAVSEQSFGNRAKALLHRLDQVQVELGVPGVARVEMQVNGPRSDPAASTVLEDLLEDAGRFARNHDHRGLAVFIDEFQEAQLGDRKSLLIALQHYDGAPSGCPVAIIAAGLPSIPEAVTEAATFGERTRYAEMSLLSDTAVAEALRVPAHAQGVMWSDQAVGAAIEVAAGYPHKVQLVGSVVWDIARPSQGAVITGTNVRDGAEEVDRQLADLFRTRLSRLTPEQRRLVEALADGGTDQATRADIASRMGVESSALSRPRQELIDRGIVEPSSRGELRFTIPGFGAYVRRQEVRRAPSPASKASDPSPEDYRLQHRAPTDDGYSAQLHHARTRFGPDVLEQPDLYGNADKETLEQMRAAVENPAAVLRIYRAVPPEHQEINAGDWVTLSRAYAHDHAYLDDGPHWPVVHADIAADRVWTDGNDPSEYGYDGPYLPDLTPYAEGEAMPPHPLQASRAATTDQDAATDIDEVVEFRPSPGATAERRIPPTTTPRDPHRGIGPAGR